MTLEEQHLLKKLGLDSPQKRKRRAFDVGLDEALLAIGPVVQEKVIAPNIDSLIDTFYGHLAEMSGARDMLPDSLSALKAKQKKYLLGLGLRCDSKQYAMSRLRVGIVHQHLGITLRHHQAASAKLQTLLVAKVIEVFGSDQEKCSKAAQFVIAATGYDMTLSSEAYFAEQTMEWEHKVDTLTRERTELETYAETDPLTGAANRRHGDRVLQSVLKTAGDNSLLLADIDWFKRINDDHGHLAGDAALIEIVHRFKSCLRKEDVLIRWGGDELAAILMDANIEIAASVAERVRLSMCESTVEFEGEALEISLSIGVVPISAGSTPMEILERADAALYDAKKAGRNRVVVAR